MRVYILTGEDFEIKSTLMASTDEKVIHNFLWNYNNYEDYSIDLEIWENGTQINIECGKVKILELLEKIINYKEKI